MTVICKGTGNIGNGGSASLPHKLRHKINLGEKELLAPPYGYVVGGHVLKPELQVVSPCTAWDHDDSTNSGSGSSDERDSGISTNGEGADKFGRQHLAPFKKGGDRDRPGVGGERDREPALETPTGGGGSGPQRKRAKKRFVEDSVLETENVQLKVLLRLVGS